MKGLTPEYAYRIPFLTLARIALAESYSMDDRIVAWSVLSKRADKETASQEWLTTGNDNKKRVRDALALDLS
jgi:hypothetical protein